MVSKHYKLIAIDVSKQIELKNPDLKKPNNFIDKLEDDTATMFFIMKNRKSNFWIFTKFCKHYIKSKQKIINWLNDTTNEESKFATKYYML